MTPATEKAVRDAMRAIDVNAKPLRGTDYFEYLEELAGRIDSYIDCYREEHPGDFE